MNLLIDTNVFLDYFLAREPFATDTNQFFEVLSSFDDSIFVTASTIRDINYFVKKETHREDIASDVVHILHANTKKIIDITSDDIINASFEDGDFEDNILIEASKRNFMDAIITRNKKDFLGKDIVTLTPTEYLKYRK